MEGNTEFQELQQLRQANLKPESQISEAGKAGWIKRLEDRFGGVFKGEKKIGGHKVTIDFFYNKHRSTEETRGMEAEFQKADIYIPEVFDWSQKYLDRLRMLSNGEISPDDLLTEMDIDPDSNNYIRDKSLFELIYNKKKAIDIVDLPYEHPLRERIEGNKFPEIQFGFGFGRTLASVREHIEKFASMQQEREAYILEQLRPRIQNQIKTHPELKKKQKINVLMSIGGGHLQLPDKLKNQYQIIQESSATPRIFQYYEKAMIKHMLDKPVDDELVARIVAEKLLSKAHEKLFVTDDSVKNVRSVRKLVSRFSFDEMKNMFEGAHDLNEWATMFTQGLKEKERVKVPAAVK